MSKTKVNVKRTFNPYPAELKDRLYALSLSMPDTTIDEKLEALFSGHPELEKFRKRLTAQRAYALIGDVRKRTRLEKAERVEFEKLFAEDRHGKLCSEIVGVLTKFRTEGIRATAIRERVAKRYPYVVFPPTQLLIRLVFHGGKKVKSAGTGTGTGTGTRKYVFEGDGFRVEVTCTNPQKKDRILSMIGTLLDD